MKIVITSQGDSLESLIDPRFGRANYFVFFDTETQEYEIEKNPYMEAPHGAGIQTSQYVLSKGVKAVITGQVGPNSWQVLSSAGIPIYAVKGGSVKEAVELFNNNKLEPISSPTGMGGFPGYGYPGFSSQEVESLKMQREYIKMQLQWIRERIERLEKE